MLSCPVWEVHINKVIHLVMNGLAWFPPPRREIIRMITLSEMW